MFAHRSAGWLGRLVTIACLGACGGATPDSVPPTVAPPDAAVAAPTASAVVDAGTAVVADVGFAKIDDPGVALCGVSSELTAGPIVPLRAKPDGAPLAWLGGGLARVGVAATGSGYFLDVTTGAAHVRAYAATADLPIRVHRAIVLGGYFIPTGTSRLTIGPTKDNKVTAFPAAIDGVTFVAPPSSDVACEDLMLTTTAIDASTALPSPPTARFARLPDRDVAISIDAKGATVAKVRRGDQRVNVLATAAGQSRIAVTLDDAVLFGWVASSDLNRDHPNPDPQIAMLQALGMPPSGAGILDGGPPTLDAPAVIAQVNCLSEVRLAAELAGERTFIGALAPSIVQIVARNESFASVYLLRAVRGTLVPATGATFLVPARDLATCWPSMPISRDAAPAPTGYVRPTPNAAEVPRDPVGAATLTSVSATTPIADAEHAVRIRLSRARSCYNIGLKADPSQHGTVAVALVVGPSGDVLSATILSNSGLSASTAACVAQGLRSISFNAPTAPSPTVTVTITFAVAKP